MLLAPLPASLGEGTAASPRLVVETWLAVPLAGPRAGPLAGRARTFSVLMLKRAALHGGFWQGVSGRVERFDASLAAAALREIREETGLNEGVEILDLGRWIEFESPFSGVPFRKRSLGAVLPAATTAASVALSEEHDEARLVTFDQARTLVRFPENVEELSALESRLAAAP